ncbi:unnamed protein product, partial [Timema podura]|nr:unnamed protein product [Timema podura]
MLTCFIPGCKSVSDKASSSKIHYFQSPQEKSVFAKWKRAIPRRNRQLSSKSRNCKIYICATKVDTEDIDSNPRQISKETATKYAQGIQAKYIETSSKTGENV